MEETFTGERDIIDNSPFPMMVDPGFFLEPHEFQVYRHDGGFWLGFLPHKSAAVQLKIGCDEVFLDGERVDSSFFLDTMRRYEPSADELDSHVEMEDPGKTAGVDIPYETWVILNDVRVEELTYTNAYGVNLTSIKLTRYHDDNPVWEESSINVFKG